MRPSNMADLTPTRNFDISVLRTLVSMVDLGGLAQASQKHGRTVAAVSLQMRKLEEQAGTELFFKDGRKLALTEAGYTVLGYARRILALNDEAQLILKQSSMAGLIRIGTSQDFGEAWLPPILAKFRQKFPSIDMEVAVDRSSQLLQAINNDELDILLSLDTGQNDNAISIGRLPLVWITHRDFDWDRNQPLPLAVFRAPCRFRDKACGALDEAGIPWNVALVSSSLYGIWAAVNAKLGITLRTPQGLLSDLQVADERFGLPDLGEIDVSLTLAPNLSKRSVTISNLVPILQASLRAHIEELRLNSELPQ